MQSVLVKIPLQPTCSSLLLFLFSLPSNVSPSSYTGYICSPGINTYNHFRSSLAIRLTASPHLPLPLFAHDTALDAYHEIPRHILNPSTHRTIKMHAFQSITSALMLLASAVSVVSAQSVSVQVVQVGDANGTLRFFPDNIQAAAGSMIQFQFNPKVS